MGLFSWLFQWFGGSNPAPNSPAPTSLDNPAPRPPTRPPASRETTTFRHARQGAYARLRTTRRNDRDRRTRRFTANVEVGSRPYRYARFGSQTGRYLDLSTDGDAFQLRQRGLPEFNTPEQLADWLGIDVNRLAWLVHRFSNGRPPSVKEAHYHFTWKKKRSGGARLIESPKQTMKQIQVKILREILDRIPPHSSAHGFVAGRSILSNAAPHSGHAIVIKFDLTNFYTTISFRRVVAIFRAVGYSREAAIWLGLLTTSEIPYNLSIERNEVYPLHDYWCRHLPQGAPTSPALANLSAFFLDVRLTEMALRFESTYTRYADDLTISGTSELSSGLRKLIPLVEQIIRRERFQSNRNKRQVLRAHQRQSVAGVVVNSHPNVSRDAFDRLKATLTNCVRHGPSTQNRNKVENFAAHLRGRIAFVTQLNPQRGVKLLQLYRKIDWKR